MDEDEWSLLRRSFAARGPEPPRPPGSVSAVLLPLYAVDGKPALLYTKRAQTLRHHPGELSFPGGRVDPEDKDPLAAALREAEEEVGIVPEDVEILGHLTDYHTYRGILVCAYVGALRGAPPCEPRSREEVEDVFVVPVHRLMDPGIYEARRIAGMPERDRIHYWRLPRCVLWGITGEITARFLAHAFGWEPPREARVVHRIEDVRPGDGTGRTRA